MILGEDNKLYYPDMIYGNTILLACSSWSRYHIEDVVGKEVDFVFSPTGHPYNFKLTENN